MPGDYFKTPTGCTVIGFSLRFLTYLHNLLSLHFNRVAPHGCAPTSEQSLCVTLRFFGFFYFALLLNGSFFSEIISDVEHISEATVCDNLSLYRLRHRQRAPEQTHNSHFIRSSVCTSVLYIVI